MYRYLHFGVPKCVVTNPQHDRWRRADGSKQGDERRKIAHKDEARSKPKIKASV
jgi:hypothetical protein